MTLQEENLVFDFAIQSQDAARLKSPLAEQLQSFSEFGKETRRIETRARTVSDDTIMVPTYVNEFWTARQRAASCPDFSSSV